MWTCSLCFLVRFNAKVEILTTISQIFNQLYDLLKCEILVPRYESLARVVHHSSKTLIKPVTTILS